MKMILKQFLNVKCVKINSCRLEEDAKNKELKNIVINVSVTKGQRCRCPVCGKKSARYDKGRETRRWRALDMGPCKVYVESEAPRVMCREHGVHTARTPWARKGASFTRDFEDQVAWMTKSLNKTAVAQYMRISWNTIGPIVTRVKKDKDPNPSHRFENLRRIGIDETSYTKGQNYITVVVNHDTGCVIWVHEKHGKDILKLFLEELTAEQRASIQCYSADGARWISETMEEYCPGADRCIDPYHLVEWVNESIDKVRIEAWQEAKARETKAAKERKKGAGKKRGGKKEEAKASKIKNTKYALGKNPENLTETQRLSLEYIQNTSPKLYRAYCLKESIRTLIKIPDMEDMESALRKWLWWASHSRIPAIYELQKKIRRHYQAILNTAKYKLSNARVEAVNNKIKLTIRMAFGFSNVQNMLDLIMLRCSDIPIELPGRKAA